MGKIAALSHPSLSSSSHHHHRLPYFFFTFFVAIAAATVGKSDASLTANYYQKSCPKLEEIVSTTVTNKQITSPTTAAGTLRLFFHDCFANGCDGSVLITSNSFNTAERDADINLSLPGDAFDAVVRVKTAVELECPGIVSCADILALASRDLVTMLGGPYYPVRLGRKDSRVSRADQVPNNLPLPSMSVTQLIDLFKSRGFTVQEMVALTGAHTVGFSHCKEFINRVNGSSADPSLNPKFGDALKKACAAYPANPSVSVFNDIMTPNKFDNMYYQNLPRGLGLLSSDAALAADARTRPFVEHYANNQGAFFDDFVRAIQKLSIVGVKTGRNGEVRRRCDEFNSIST